MPFPILYGWRAWAFLLATATLLITASMSVAVAAAARANPLAQFNRTTLSYSSALSTSAEAYRYQVLVMQSTDHVQAMALKAANPKLKIFMYSDLIDTRQNDPLGWTTCTDYATDNAGHPGWFLLDQNRNRIIDKSYPGNYLMDAGNPAYQQACISHSLSLAKLYGFDGVYFDNATASIAWTLPNGISTPTYPTLGRWQTAMYSMLSHAGPRIHSRGLLVVANIAASPTTPGLWQKWTAPLDGSGDETFGESTMHHYWSSQLANAAWSEANGKYALMHSHDTSETANTFGLASMMLIAGGKASWSTSNANYTTDEKWFPEYNTAQALGAPTGAYTKLSSGVYVRGFANGVVLVNPSATTHAVALSGGTYTGSGLSSVSNVSLGAWSGSILLADTPSSTPPVTIPPVTTPPAPKPPAPSRPRPRRRR